MQSVTGRCYLLVLDSHSTPNNIAARSSRHGLAPHQCLHAPTCTSHPASPKLSAGSHECHAMPSMPSKRAHLYVISGCTSPQLALTNAMPCPACPEARCHAQHTSLPPPVRHIRLLLNRHHRHAGINLGRQRDLSGGGRTGGRVSAQAPCCPRCKCAPRLQQLLVCATALTAVDTSHRAKWLGTCRPLSMLHLDLVFLAVHAHPHPLLNIRGCHLQVGQGQRCMSRSWRGRAV